MATGCKRKNGFGKRNSVGGEKSARADMVEGLVKSRNKKLRWSTIFSQAGCLKLVIRRLIKPKLAQKTVTIRLV